MADRKKHRFRSVHKGVCTETSAVATGDSGVRCNQNQTPGMAGQGEIPAMR